MKYKFILALFTSILFFLISCLGTSVQKDLVWDRNYQPQQYRRLAVIDLDPQVLFAEFVEAELLRKGYQPKEGSIVRQALNKEGLSKEGPFDAQVIAKIGKSLDVQGIVLCSVLEFTRFRDSYRLSIKMVAPNTGYTIWTAQGAAQGRKGEKSGELLRKIVVSSLKELPSIP